MEGGGWKTLDMMNHLHSFILPLPHKGSMNHLCILRHNHQLSFLGGLPTFFLTAGLWMTTKGNESP